MLEWNNNVVLAYLGHTAINNKVSAINEAALIASQEEDSLSLLNSLSESSTGEMDLSSQALGSIITQPILKERSTNIFS